MAIKINGTTVVDDTRKFIPLTVEAGGTVGTAGSVLASTGTGVEWVPGGSGSGSGSGEFNTGITSTVQVFPDSWDKSLFIFPSTENKKYIIQSINAANVAVGDTQVNININIGNDDKSYLAYNVPIPSGGFLEVLKQPIVANPLDEIRGWSSDFTYVGISTAVELYINYTETDDTNYFRVIASDSLIPTGEINTIYTSVTYPSMLQSIHITNKTDIGDYPVSVVIENGDDFTYLVKDLIIPRYASVNILDRPKRMEINGKIQVIVGQVSTLDIIVAGKKIVE
jgi:hypothetical protein